MSASAATSASPSRSRAIATRPKRVARAAASNALPPLITETCAKNHTAPEARSTASAIAAERRLRTRRAGSRATHRRKANSPASAIAAAKCRKRASAISSDTALRSHLEAVLAARDVAVRGEHAPDHPVGARDERRERHLEQLRFARVDARILAVDLPPALVQHLHRAVGRLERVRGP